VRCSGCRIVTVVGDESAFWLWRYEYAFPRNIAIAIGPAQRSLRSDLLPGALITHKFRRNSLLKETPICTTDHLCPEHWHWHRSPRLAQSAASARAPQIPMRPPHSGACGRGRPPATG
jgi:hypothetical protein